MIVRYRGRRGTGRYGFPSEWCVTISVPPTDPLKALRQPNEALTASAAGLSPVARSRSVTNIDFVEARVGYWQAMSSSMGSVGGLTGE